MTTRYLVSHLSGFFDHVRSDYSGRGMYGKVCPGFQCASVREAFAGVAAMIADEEDPDTRDELASIVSRCQVDEMGRGIIVYFPQFKEDE